MKSVAADNPKLVHGGDRLKEIAERIKSDEAGRKKTAADHLKLHELERHTMSPIIFVSDPCFSGNLRLISRQD